jgi:F420-dependent oxidoreductase-like protein
MKLSVSITNYSWPQDVAIGRQLSSIASRLDETALDTLWVADHLMQADPSSADDEPMLEAYTTLGFLAAETKRIRLGTMVTAATFRAPALLMKAVTTLDVLSGGRAWLGIGAGYNSDEATALGLDLPPTAERFERMTELLRLARQMWAGDQSPFRGKHVRLERPIARPLPINPPPVLIGGTGARRTLRLVAEYGDACNLFDTPDGHQVLGRQLDTLRSHCAEVGRRYDDIERTVSTALGPEETVGAFVDRCRSLADVGLQHVVVIARGKPFTDRDVDILAEAAAKLANG